MHDNYPRDVLRKCDGCHIAYPLRNTKLCINCFAKIRGVTDDRLLDTEIRLAIAEGSLAALAEIVGTLTGDDGDL